MATARTSELASPVEFFDQQVAPVVFQRLDELFPEFGFTRDQRGWRATNDETTRAFFGARADRVVCHKSGGFYVHGQGPVPWLSHLESGAMPRGRDYVEAVRRLAHAAGVDTTSLDHPQRATTVRDSGVPAIREAWFQHAVDLLGHPARGADARAYLESRGITQLDAITGLVGVAPHQTEAWRRLVRDGHEPAAISASGVLSDSRTPGRVVGAWRDQSGAVATIWARSTNPDAPSRERYLYTRGARRPALPYLAHETTASEIVMVEGVLDALAMRARGHDAAVALGGSSAGETTWRALSRHGVRHAWLLADHDAAGDQACRTATRSLLRTDARTTPVHPPRTSQRRAQGHGRPAHCAPRVEHRHGMARRVLRRLRRARDTQHPRRPRLEAKRAASSVRRGHCAFSPACPTAHTLGREAATRTLAAWARVDPSVIHAVTHTHEDASSLRERVRQLETAITTARSLIGDARLPTPTGGAEHLGHTLDAHERITSAYQALSAALPVFPATATPPPAHHEPQHLPERGTR